MIQIIVGTETGTAEYVADEIVELLSEHGITSTADINIEPSELDPKGIWLICTSTHGAGDTPANLNAFKTMLETTPPNLAQLKFAVIGLGDSSYDTYCHAADYFSDKLKDLGATELFPIIKADAMSDEMPEDIIIEQLTPLISQLK